VDFIGRAEVLVASCASRTAFERIRAGAVDGGDGICVSGEGG
jgi:hypothetical protein